MLVTQRAVFGQLSPCWLGQLGSGYPTGPASRAREGPSGYVASPQDQLSRTCSAQATVLSPVRLLTVGKTAVEVCRPVARTNSGRLVLCLALIVSA